MSLMTAGQGIEQKRLQKRWKRWIFAFVFLILAGFVALNILAYRHAYTMMHFVSGKPRTGLPETLSLPQKLGVLFSGVSIPRPYSTGSANALGPMAKSLKISESNHISLGAWYAPGPTNAPLVILFHGYTGEKSGELSEAKVFQQLGCGVLLVDFRGSGESSESYTTVGYCEAEDVAAAVRYAREKFAPSKIILYGQSMGAAAVLRAVAECGVVPDAVISESVFDRLLTTVKHRFEAMHVPTFPGAELLVFWGGKQAGFDGFRLNPVDYAVNVKCPILFLHGAADPRAHLEEGRRVYEAVPGPKTFKQFNGVGHAPAIVRYPQEWTSAVNDFLTSNSLLSKTQRAGDDTAQTLR